MTSRFAWLDNNADQNKRMSVLVDLFKDKSSVDELGIGTIRDTFANALFPGTSVLHTRARYLLFIPWLLRDVAQHGWPSDRAQHEFRAREVRLINALLAGGEAGNGVIGEQARHTLKRMPSAAYWAALGRYGLRKHDTSVAGFFRRATQSVRLSRSYIDDEAGCADIGVDPEVGRMRDGLLTSTTFDLTPDEGSYVRDKIATRCKGSLLSELMLTPDPAVAAAGEIWEHPLLSSFETQHRRLIDHGKRFHFLQRGAALLYNLRLAELAGSEDLAAEYHDAIAEWGEMVTTEDCLGGWDFEDFWACVLSENSRIKTPTRIFVSMWHRVVSDGDILGANARGLIADRELRLKGARSRIHNPSARKDWSGGAGLVVLSYRWEIARRYLQDVAHSTEVADAVA